MAPRTPPTKKRKQRNLDGALLIFDIPTLFSSDWNRRTYGKKASVMQRHSLKAMG